MAKIKTFLDSINWKVRAKNKVFWIALIPTALLLANQVLNLFGITFDYNSVADQLVKIVETAFILLGIVGIVADPTTKGLKDSTNALGYVDPKED